MARCLIGLGANLGDRPATLARAVELLAAPPHVQLLDQSAWHPTSPIGGPAGQTEFLNGALLLETSLSPRQVHAELRCIEAALGRRRGERWAPRVVDLDLLIYEAAVISTPELVVPHPRMAFRRFVLEPAVEVAAELMHPQIDWTIAQLLDHLNRAKPYVALVGGPGLGKTALAQSLANHFSGRAIVDSGLPAAADSTGRQTASEIEFVERRARLLAADRWTEAESPWISDFWLEQSLAYAALNPRGGSPDLVRGMLESSRGQVIAPKLLVIVDPPIEAASTPTSATVFESRAQMRVALVELATQPGRGPWLHLATADAAALLSETSAAIEAMN